jgi:hypothetical protein
MLIHQEHDATSTYYFDCIFDNKYKKMLAIDCKGGLENAVAILKNYKGDNITGYVLDLIVPIERD